MWWPFGRRPQPPGNVIQFPAGGRDFLPGGKYVNPLTEPRPIAPGAVDTLPPINMGLPRDFNPYPPGSYEHAQFKQHLEKERPRALDREHFMPYKEDETPDHLLRRVAGEIQKGNTDPAGMFIGTIEEDHNGHEVLRFYFTGLNRLEVIGLLADLLKEMP